MILPTEKLLFQDEYFSVARSPHLAVPHKDYNRVHRMDKVVQIFKSFLETVFVIRLLVAILFMPHWFCIGAEISGDKPATFSVKRTS